MRHHPARASAVLTALLLAAPAARAQLYLGQSFTAPGAPNTRLLSLRIGPTGLAGQSGNGADYVAQLFAFNGTALVGPSLFDQVLGPQFAGLALTPDRTLLPGAMYAVVVADQGGGLSGGSNADTDAGASAVFCSDPSACRAPFGPGDLNGFAVTFGPATTVPEPATWALLGTGLVGVGAVAQRRRTPRTA